MRKNSVLQKRYGKTMREKVSFTRIGVNSKEKKNQNFTKLKSYHYWNKSRTFKRIVLKLLFKSQSFKSEVVK